MTTIAGGSGLAIPSSGNMACAGATDKFGDGCLATAISFTATDDMRAVVGDVFGNVYLSDISAGLVRRISPNGVISNFAGRVTGTACVPGATAGCTPTLVSISKPRGVGTDAAGNIYIADYSTNKVYKVSVSTGLMYLVAGNGTAGSTGDGGPGATAEVSAPRGAWADTVGNIYIADTGANNIRVVDATGNIHTFAGAGTASSTGDGGSALTATVNNPQGVITDVNLNVYIADSSGGKIRVVCVTCGSNSPLDKLLAKFSVSAPVNGNIYTIAGGASTASTAYPTLGTNVTMAPQKLAFDGGGNLYISDGNGMIWFLDFHTGYIRPIASNSTTLCAGKTDSFGDGCPATQASFGDGGNGIGVGTDPLGNMYISDTTNGLIRKVVTGLASPSTATSATATLPVQIHFTPGDSPAAANAFAYTSSEWQLGAPACTTNADTTMDCLLFSGFTPAAPGARSTGLTVNSTAGNTANLALTGTGLGAGATLDPASQISFGASLQVTGLATDNSGNIYVADAGSKKLFRFSATAVAQGSSAVGTALATLTAPGAVAVDPRGYVYVADTSTGLITQVPPAGVVTTLAAKFTSPAGLAIDALDNLYVSDSSTLAVYQVSLITGAQRTLAVGPLVAPAGLAIDPSSNLLVTDPGAGAVYRFNLSSGVQTTVTSPATKPSAVVADAAGNLLIVDTAAIFAVPASSNSSPFTVAGVTPSALAIDASGNLYTGSAGSLLKLVRTQGYVSFQNAVSTPPTLSLLESGNQTLQLSTVSQSDTADYNLTASASTDCTLNGALPASAAVGGVCSLTATFTPTTYIKTTDTATFNGNLSNTALSTPAAVQLVLTGPAVPPTPAIALGAFSPASPVYGQTVTVSATISGASVVPAGTVAFTIDNSTSTTSASLVSGVATLSLSSLGAGTHTVSAAYTSSNGYASVSTSTSSVTVTQATQTISFTAPASPATYGVSSIALSATGGASGNAVVLSVLSGPGTVTGSTLTVTGAGTIQIAANQAGNTNYAAATQVTRSIVINTATQTISFPAPTSPVTFGVSPIALSASGGASGNAVVFSVVSGPGIVTGSTLTVTGAGTILIAANQAGNTNYAAATQMTQSITVSQAAQTITFTAPASPATFGTSPIALSASGGASGNAVVFSVVSGPGTISGSTLTVTGAGTIQIAANQSGNTNYIAATSVTRSIVVNQAAQTIVFAAPSSPVTFGVAPIALSATGGASGNAIVFSVVSGPGTISGSTLTLTGAGTVQIAANQAGNTNYTAAAQVAQSIVVNKAALSVGVQSSANPVLVQTSITLTTTVSASAGVPTGTVSFLDGTTPLGTGALVSGVATLSTSTLAVGSHSITAVYSGDANFVTLTSSVLTETVEDFSVSIPAGSATSLTLLPGGTGTLTFTMSPSGAATFPAAVTLSLTGLPAGATYTFSPATLAAGSSTTTVTLTIQLAKTAAGASPVRIDGNRLGITTAGVGGKNTPSRNSSAERKLAPFALALLLLPFACGVRRAGRKLGRAMSLLLLVVVGLAATIGMSGCGASGSGFFAQAPNTYTLSVIGTSGTVSRFTNITLTVE